MICPEIALKLLWKPNFSVHCTETAPRVLWKSGLIRVVGGSALELLGNCTGAAVNEWWGGGFVFQSAALKLLGCWSDQERFQFERLMSGAVPVPHWNCTESTIARLFISKLTVMKLLGKCSENDRYSPWWFFNWSWYKWKLFWNCSRIALKQPFISVDLIIETTVTGTETARKLLGKWP